MPAESPPRPPWYKSRQLRTVILALTATATFVGSAILVFDVDWRVMANFFLVCLAGLAVVMVGALVFTACRILLRRWFG